MVLSDASSVIFGSVIRDGAIHDKSSVLKLYPISIKYHTRDKCINSAVYEFDIDGTYANVTASKCRASCSEGYLFAFVN